MLIEGLAHRSNVTGSCAAAAPDQVDSGLGKAQRIICEIIGGCHVEKAVADTCRQTRVGLRRKQSGRSFHIVALLFDRSDHFLHHIECRSRSYATIGPHHIDTKIVEYRRYSGR